jgi:glutamyl-tRNA reductase
MIDQLHYFGATHRTTPLAHREALARQRPEVGRIREAFQGIADEIVILSTCGRFEVYLAASAEVQSCGCTRLASALGTPLDWTRDSFTYFGGQAVAIHLFRVAAGLDTRIFAEDQILSQTRAAFATAQQSGDVGPLLSSLFRTAIHTGRSVRSSTEAARSRSSFAQLTCAAVQQRVPIGAAVVVLGTGALARDIGAALARSMRLYFVSHHVDRARKLGDTVGGVARPLDALPNLVPEARAIIGCTTTRRHLVTADMMVRSNECVIIDLGLPRNIDPNAAAVPGVSLFHLEDLPTGRAISLAARRRAHQAVDTGLHRFDRWLAGRSVSARIQALLSQIAPTEPSALAVQRRSTHEAIVRLKEQVQ